MKTTVIAVSLMAAVLAIAPVSDAHAKNHRHNGNTRDNTAAIVAAGVTGAVLALATTSSSRTVVVAHQPVYAHPVYIVPAPVYYYNHPPVYRHRPVHYKPVAYDHHHLYHSHKHRSHY